MNDLELHTLPGETQPRKLGRVPPSNAAMLVRKVFATYDQFLDANKLKRIPQSDWKPINRRDLFDKSWVNNQEQFGACVGASCAMAFSKIRVLRGHDRHDLSWGYAYDQINGGRDQGACITDAMGVAQKGIPLFEEYKVPVFNTRLQPASRLRFQLLGGFTWGSWLDGCDIIQRGGMVQYPVQVGSNYNRFTQDKCCGIDKGAGNHSVHSDGMVFLSSLNAWVWDHMGSWDVTWAFDGRAYHRQANIENCAVENDAFGHMTVSDDPQEDSP